MKRPLRFFCLTLLTLGLCCLAVPSPAEVHRVNSLVTPATISQEAAHQSLSEQAIFEKIDQGQRLYESGQFSSAIKQLQQVIRESQANQDLGQEIRATRNLALVYLQNGQWEEAKEAIATSLEKLETSKLPELLELRASVLDVQGKLLLNKGETQNALSSWQQAESLYRELGNTTKRQKSQLNQAQALQQLGFYRQATELLRSLITELNDAPDSLTKVVSLRRLGDTLQIVGDLEQAQAVLEESLSVAQTLGLPDAIATGQLSLGNLMQSVGQIEQALELYGEVADTRTSSPVQLKARLNRLDLWIKTDQQPLAQAELSKIRPLLDGEFVMEGSMHERIPSSASRSLIFSQVNFAQSLIQLSAIDRRLVQESGQWLARAIEQAEVLGDRRAESYAKGTLGHLYERTGQLRFAQQLTEQALFLAQQNRASDIAYRWEWQLGRVFRAQMAQNFSDAKSSEDAYQNSVAAYTKAVDSLKELRKDLAAVNPDTQVSFQESIEPIHRELVDLLLSPENPGQANSNQLEQARLAIESLQLAELDNFFREACLTAQPVVVDQLDQKAAIIYPILLPDRLETIVSLPEGQLRHYTQLIPQDQIEAEINELRRRLVLPIGQLFRPSSQQLYDWLIRPLEVDLVANDVGTLVFVLDGDLKNIPMGALNDGEQFLIENYSLALTPGLQLLEPQPIQSKSLGALTGGLSKSRQGFSALPNVLNEVEQIQAELPSQVLLNENFTIQELANAVTQSSEPILHLATHGQFSSQKKDTFILTWDERLGIDEFSQLLRNAELKQDSLIELLVLSACREPVTVPREKSALVKACH